MTKLNVVPLFGSNAWPVLCAADNPFGRLPDHFALLSRRKQMGAGGFHGLGKVVGHCQWHDGLLAGDLHG